MIVIRIAMKNRFLKIWRLGVRLAHRAEIRHRGSDTPQDRVAPVAKYSRPVRRIQNSAGVAAIGRGGVPQLRPGQAAACSAPAPRAIRQPAHAAPARWSRIYSRSAPPSPREARPRCRWALGKSSYAIPLSNEWITL